MTDAPPAGATVREVIVAELRALIGDRDNPGEIADYLLATLEENGLLIPPDAATASLVCVPREDTGQMNEAGYNALSEDWDMSECDGEALCQTVSRIYRAMLAAAPATPRGDEKERG